MTPAPGDPEVIFCPDESRPLNLQPRPGRQRAATSGKGKEPGRAPRRRPRATYKRTVEPVWSHLKRSVANLTKQNIAQLTALVKTRLKRMQYRPGLLGGFPASTGLDLTPFCNSHH